MSEEQKRQWAMIMWYHANIKGPIELAINMLYECNITPEECKEIAAITQSFTEQPKP